MADCVAAAADTARRLGVSSDGFYSIWGSICSNIAGNLSSGKSVSLPAFGTFFTDGSGAPVFVGTVASVRTTAKAPAAPGRLNTIAIANECKQSKDHIQAVLTAVSSSFGNAVSKQASSSVVFPGVGTLRYSGSSRTASFAFDPSATTSPTSTTVVPAAPTKPAPVPPLKSMASVAITPKQTTSKPAAATTKPPAAGKMVAGGASGGSVRSGLSASTPIVAHAGSKPSRGPAAAVKPSAPGLTVATGAKGSSAARSGPKFTDPEFPPNRTSLCHDWSLCPSASEWGKLVWRRATEFCPGELPTVFFDGIDPGDVAQGILGDCYFLSALSVLAEHGHRIRKLFITQEGNYEGRYQVTWYQNGTPIVVTIDDYFPCDPVTGQPAFTHCRGPELWVVILEKAWAKVHGSYQNIEGGSAPDVLSALTGAPGKTFKLQGEARSRKGPDHEAIWAEMIGAETSTFVLTCAVPDDPMVDMLSVAGLVEGHAYGILDVRQAGPHRLIKIRNPWGNTEWNGDWSDSSSKWTPELKRQLGWTAENDGTFWMEYADFKKLFCEVSIVRVRDSFVMNCKPLPTLGAGQLIGVELTVREPTTCCVELHQSSKRCFPKEAFTFQYGGVILEVVSTTPPALLGTSQPAKSSSVFVELELQAGKYIVVCRGAVDRKRQVAVSTYSSAPVGLSVMATPPAALETMLAPAYAAEAVSKGTKLAFGGMKGLDAYEYSTGAVTVITYANNTPKTFGCRLNMDLTNMLPATQPTASATLALPPGATQTVVSRVNRPGEALGFGYRHEDVTLR